jgi:hypothetical protein
VRGELRAPPPCEHELGQAAQARLSGRLSTQEVLPVWFSLLDDAEAG